MSISRRHFDAIARAVKANHKDSKLSEVFVYELADILATTSGSFNKPMFLKACGFEVKESCNGSI